MKGREDRGYEKNTGSKYILGWNLEDLGKKAERLELLR